MISLKFDEKAARAAYDAWGCNCGPSALAAIAGTTLEEAADHLAGFTHKHYTNPTMMLAGLKSMGLHFTVERHSQNWPKCGLVRVQWEGPWTKAGVPMRARYRHTHWVASHKDARGTSIFDINAIHAGGWIALRTWTDNLVPWIIRELVTKNANGRWHLTHVIEISRGA